MVAANQTARNGDLRHKQSIGRQRKQADAPTPALQAAALARCIRKRLADGQNLYGAMFRGLSEETWSELISLLSDDEVLAVQFTPADDTADDLNETFADVADDEPLPIEMAQTPEPQAPVHTPSWRDREPAIVHSLKWRDSEGIEHLHVVRADTLDEALLHIRKIKACIAAARAQSEAPKAEPAPQGTNAADAPEEDTHEPKRCEIHGVDMGWSVSKRTGKPYPSHRKEDGTLCFGRPKA